MRAFLSKERLRDTFNLDLWDTNLGGLVRTCANSETLLSHSKLSWSTQRAAGVTVTSPLLEWTRTPEGLFPAFCFGVPGNDFIHTAHFCPLQFPSGP